MKRLFQVNASNGLPVTGDDDRVAYFGNKPEAKKFRDQCNADAINAKFTVAIGPDHQGLRSRKSRGHIKANRTHA